MSDANLDKDQSSVVNEAIEKIVAGEMTLQEAAESFSIDESILSTFLEEAKAEEYQPTNEEVALDEKALSGGDIQVLKDRWKVHDKARNDSSLSDAKKQWHAERATSLANKIKMAGGLDKKVVKEDIEDLDEHLSAFFKGEEVSEEFQAKVRTIFENAVIVTSQKIIDKNTASLEEAFETRVASEVERLEEEAETHKTSLDEKVDEYLQVVVEEWREKNRPALVSSVRAELAESFMGDLKNLLEKHYIDLPEEKLDLVNDLREQVEARAADIDRLMEENVRIARDRDTILRESVVARVSVGMADSEAERLVGLSENLDFENAEQFKNALRLVRESYFSEEVSSTPLEAGDEPINEEVEQTPPTKPESRNSEVSSVARILSGRRKN